MRDRHDDTTHRDIATRKLGRPLKVDEVAHHVDENKAANNNANIEVKSRAAHSADHAANRTTSKVRAALRMVKERRKLY